MSVCADIGVSSDYHAKGLTPQRRAAAGNEMRDDINRYAADQGAGEQINPERPFCTVYGIETSSNYRFNLNPIAGGDVTGDLCMPLLIARVVNQPEACDALRRVMRIGERRPIAGDRDGLAA